MKETKFISEMEYLNFKNKLRNIIIEIIIGMVIGLLVNKYIMGVDEISSYVFWAIMCAGIPYAWQCMPVFLGGIIGLMLNFVIAMILGWAITPIAFVYNLIQMKRYEKHVKAAAEKENAA
jgi:hypothetical protein